jgi:hypothetical protein
MKHIEADFIKRLRATSRSNAAAVRPLPEFPLTLAELAHRKAPAPEKPHTPASWREVAEVGARGALDQLSRIEDKTGRIEEKYARTEIVLSCLQDRFDAATRRIGDVAMKRDVIALHNQVGTLSERVRRIPGAGILMVTAVATALLTSTITVSLVRNLPPDNVGLIADRFLQALQRR